MSLDTRVLDGLRHVVQKPLSEREILDDALRLMAKWRSTLIQNTVVQQYGTTVQAGPFKGMQITRASAEGCHAPKLLGSYEQELHPHVEAAVLRDYRNVIVIGMAEGYYAVGLALRMPNAQVHAFDTDERTHPFCGEVSALNKVQIASKSEDCSGARTLHNIRREH